VTLKEKPTIDDARASLATPGLPNGYYLGHFGLHLFQPALFDCLAYLIETNTRVKNEIQLTSAQELLRERAARGEAGPYLAAYLGRHALGHRRAAGLRRNAMGLRPRRTLC
jgi:UTP--glucose-1-phosphate uridylyltransferase